MYSRQAAIASPGPAGSPWPGTTCSGSSACQAVEDRKPVLRREAARQVEVTAHTTDHRRTARARRETRRSSRCRCGRRRTRSRRRRPRSRSPVKVSVGGASSSAARRRRSPRACSAPTRGARAREVVSICFFSRGRGRGRLADRLAVDSEARIGRSRERLCRRRSGRSRRAVTERASSTFPACAGAPRPAAGMNPQSIDERAGDRRRSRRRRRSRARPPPRRSGSRRCSKRSCVERLPQRTDITLERRRALLGDLDRARADDDRRRRARRPRRVLRRRDAEAGVERLLGRAARALDEAGERGGEVGCARRSSRSA